MANTIISELWSIVEFIVASTEDLDPLLQINTQQCKLLAKKAFESLLILGKFQEAVLQNQGQENISWTLAAKELYRVLKDAKILITDCCDGQWLKVIIRRGTMKEAFQGLMYNIQLHTSVLNSTFILESKGIIFEKTICDGKLDATELSSLSAAAKQDQDSLLGLLKRLKGDHSCSGESCMQDLDNQQCLAARYLDKMDGEELVLANRNNLSASNPFLSVHPRDFSGKSRFLGKGSFGTVKEKVWMGEKYAMKKFIGESAVPFFEKEIAALAGLNHPNIVHVVGCYKKDENSLGIIMELMYKSLNDLLKDYRKTSNSTSRTTPFSIIQAVNLMLQIAEGVRYIHNRSLVHYDLKSLNILIQFADPDQISIPSDMDFSNVSFIAKISDFGLTTIKNASDNIALNQNEMLSSISILEGVKIFRSCIRAIGMILLNTFLVKKVAKADKHNTSLFGQGEEKPKIGSDTNKQVEQNEGSSEKMKKIICTSSEFYGYLFQLEKSGVQKYNDGNYKEAIADFDASYNIEPNNAFTLSMRGALKIKLNDFENALNDLNKANELDSNNCFIKIQRGEAKRSLRDFEGALMDLNDANALTPNHGFILAHRGAVKMRLGHFVEALEDLNRVHELTFNDAFIYQQRGVVMHELKDLEGALSNFNMAHELMPMDAYTLCCRGMTKRELFDFQGSLEDLDMAYNIQPQCVLTLKNRGDIKRILCKYEEALEDLNLASEIHPNDSFTLSTRGTVYKELKKYQNALEDLNKANDLDCDNCFIKTQRGEVKRRLRDFEGALADLNDASTLTQDHGIILAQQGAVKLELGHFVDALDNLNRAQELKPKDAFIYQQRGVVLRELGNLEGALDDLNMAYSINSNEPYTLLCRGVTKRELLDYQGSLEDLNMSNILQPCNNLTLNERGVTKKLLGDFQGALEDLCMANHIKGDQAFTLKHRGSANRELGNFVEAVQDLTCANYLEPNDFFTLLELAMTKSLNHDYEGALINYNQVVEMEPNDPWILRQRGYLRRMLEDYEEALQDLNKGDINSDELQPKLFNIVVARILERCFTKYAMKDVPGALQDAKMVRELWGKHGQSLIMGERLKPATIQCYGSSKYASSSTQRLTDISRYVLWIDHENLKFVKSLGRGSYGYVQKCKWEGKNRLVAVKYVSSQVEDAFEKEVEILARIQHPRVVRLIGCSYDNTEKQGLMVMELMEYNLRSLIDLKKRKGNPPFDLSAGVHIMVQIAQAMEYLHEQGVLHRDLKSSNVLVNSIPIRGDEKEQYVVKIADFGMAKLQGQNNMPYFMTVDVGATLWRAPEVFKIGTYQKYSFPVDVWSYGMTCYEILSGEVPFEGVTCSQIRTKILGGLRPELPTSCPGVLKLLLKKCWSFSPCDRPTFSEIHKILRLYEGIDASRDTLKLKVGDAIRTDELRKHAF